MYREMRHMPTLRIEGLKQLLLQIVYAAEFNMKNLSNNLKHGYAYRKPFPGATSEEILHYAYHTVTKDSPDSVIINAGSNDLNRLDSDRITDNIMQIVNMCHEHGVSKVYVSSITYRKGQEEKIYTLNGNLRYMQGNYGFTYIDNSNITLQDIWKDNIHLNNQGLAKITNNFICALNENKQS